MELTRETIIEALKLRALRGGARDRADALMLARHLGLTTKEALAAVVARNFPGDRLDERRLRLIEDLGAELSE